MLYSGPSHCTYLSHWFMTVKHKPVWMLTMRKQRIIHSISCKYSLSIHPNMKSLPAVTLPALHMLSRCLQAAHWMHMYHCALWLSHFFVSNLHLHSVLFCKLRVPNLSADCSVTVHVKIWVIGHLFVVDIWALRQRQPLSLLWPAQWRERHFSQEEWGFHLWKEWRRISV